MTVEIRLKSENKSYSMIHLAGLASVSECEKNPERARALNIDSSLKWYQAATATGCKRFIYVSTSHIFAAQKTPLTVSSPAGPRSVYAKTKYEAEESLIKNSTGSSTELVIARVFSILPKMLRPGYLLTSLHQRAKMKDFSPIPGLSNVRDFISTAEIGRQLVELTYEPVKHQQLVLICTGQGRTIREIAEQVFREHGLDGQSLKEAPGRPDDVPYIVGTPYEFKN